MLTHDLWITNPMRQEKEIKGIDTDRKGRHKTVSKWNDCLCRKSQTSNKFLEPIISYSKVAGYKVIHKSHLLPYISATNTWNVKLKT